MLLAGGLLASIVVAVFGRLTNRFGARRRARQARRALHDRIAQVADELVLAPLQGELDTHAALLHTLDEYRGRPLRRGATQSPAPVL